MKIRENVKISELTTMRLGGPARFVVEVEELADVPKAYDFAREKKLPVWVLGGGANTIGRDEGFDGVIILNHLKGIEVLSQTADEVVLRAMGGEDWDEFVDFCCTRGYSGVEALSKIPGTVGAAPVQNIGAYGQEASQVIESVEVFDTWAAKKRADGNAENDVELLKVLGKEDLKMSYRSTIFNSGAEAGRYFIVAVNFVLENDASLTPPLYNSLQNYMDENGISDYSPMSIRKAVSAVRASKVPDPKKEASAGSFFKNIFLDEEQAVKVAARGIKVWTKSDGRKMINSGYLIEGAGLKGAILNGFKVSDKAALVLINSGEVLEGGKKRATRYADLAAARKKIQDAVREKYKLEMEQEPVEIVTIDKTSANTVMTERGKRR